MPPQVNATLTAVVQATAAQGAREDWEGAFHGTPGSHEPAGAGAAKWSGSVDAFLLETTDRVSGPDGVDVYERRRLYIDAADARTIGLDTNDVITFTGPDGNARQAIAVNIDIAELDGIPRELQTATLELRPA